MAERGRVHARCFFFPAVCVLLSRATRDPFAASAVDQALTEYLERTEQLRSVAARAVEQELKALQRLVRLAY